MRLVTRHILLIAAIVSFSTSFGQIWSDKEDSGGGDIWGNDHSAQNQSTSGPGSGTDPGGNVDDEVPIDDWIWLGVLAGGALGVLTLRGLKLEVKSRKVKV